MNFYLFQKPHGVLLLGTVPQAVSATNTFSSNSSTYNIYLYLRLAIKPKIKRLHHICKRYKKIIQGSTYSSPHNQKQSKYFQMAILKIRNKDFAELLEQTLKHQIFSWMRERESEFQM